MTRRTKLAATLLFLISISTGASFGADGSLAAKIKEAALRIVEPAEAPPARGELEVASEIAGVAIRGAGTAESPFIVETVEQLQVVDARSSAYFELARDLVLDGDWTPLCAERAFEGRLDGGGHKISGLSVENREYSGLFDQIGANGRVWNLELEGRLTLGSRAVAAGGLAARFSGLANGVTSRVDVVIASDVDASAAIGGLVGDSGGVALYCAYSGAIDDARAKGGAVGAIAGRVGEIVSRALPDLVTAHAGFAAPGGARDTSEDNTLANIAKAVGYSPDVVEVDVRRDRNGVLVISHNAPRADAPTLDDVLQLLLGRLPEGFDFPDFDPDRARKVGIQLDMKEDGIFLLALDVVKRNEFPLNRVILAGDSTYETVLKNIDAIRAAVDEGLEFWMNPDRIDSYENMTKRSDAFLAKIKAFGLPRVTVNTSYAVANDAVRDWLAKNDLQISTWTLNSEDALRNNLLRGEHNATSRLPLAVEMRDACRTRGVFKNEFDAGKYREVGEAGE